jgi:hypothetical protein
MEEDRKPEAVPGQIDEGLVAWQHSPANPNNWSRGKKLYHTSICAAYAFTMYASLEFSWNRSPY